MLISHHMGGGNETLFCPARIIYYEPRVTWPPTRTSSIFNVRNEKKSTVRARAAWAVRKFPEHLLSNGRLLPESSQVRDHRRPCVSKPEVWKSTRSHRTMFENREQLGLEMQNINNIKLQTHASIYPMCCNCAAKTKCAQLTWKTKAQRRPSSVRTDLKSLKSSATSRNYIHLRKLIMFCFVCGKK